VLRTARKRAEGGSTITQQLAKNNYAGSDRTFARKLREVLYASKLENRYEKDELLERYLNQIYFGESAYGLTAAARTFFAKPANELTVAEAATLAGKIRAPERLDPRTQPEAVIKRRNQVVRAMVVNNWLAATEAKVAEAAPLVLAPEAPPDVARAPHFVEYVKREAAGIAELGPDPDARSLRLFTGGLKVETTLDPRYFDAATEAVRAQLGEAGDPAVAAVTIKPGDGAILSLFGGLSFERKFDVASQGRRQPGSSYKPFVYLAMLQAGIDPRSTYPASSPQTFEYQGEVFDVGNYEDEGGGESNVDDAMVHSLNTVFMRIGLDVGPDRVVAAARAAHDPGDPGAIATVPSVALGGLSQGVTPLEHAAAYATFAAHGRYAAPYAITRITDRSGKVLYEHQVDVTEVYRDLEVGVLTAALQRVVTEGTGRGAAIGRPLAGKTGTTQNYGDAWFAGFVPQAATAVWVGDPTRITPMLDVHGRRVTGGSFPASIFAATMRAGLEGVPVEPLFTATPDQLTLQLATTTTSSTAVPDAPAVTEATTTTTPTTAPPETTTTRPPSETTTSPPPTTAPPPTTSPSSSPPPSSTAPPSTTTTSKKP
jgi:penicillin-binding protein 1A